MKIPIKTRLPVEAWVFAALVTLYSLTSSMVQQPVTEAEVKSAATSFSFLSDGISDLTELPRRALWLHGDRG